MKITTYYHPFESDEDPIEDVFENSLELEDYINSMVSDFNQLVYVLAYESKHFNTLFVEHETFMIDTLAATVITEMCDFDAAEKVDASFFLFELDSYQEAYNLCVDMKEPTGFAYRKQFTDDATKEVLNIELSNKN